MLDGVSAFPRVLFPFVSQCTPDCFPLLDGVPSSPRVLSPFFSRCSLLFFLCWMVCPPSRGSCLPLFRIVPLLFLILVSPMLGLGFMWDLCGTYVGPLLVHAGAILGLEQAKNKVFVILGLVSRPRSTRHFWIMSEPHWASAGPMLVHVVGSWGPCWGHVEPRFGQEHRCPKSNTPFWVDGQAPTLG